MTETPNLHLTKDAATEHYSVARVNANSDKIDAYAGAVNTALEGKQDTLTFDDAPTQSSSNPVKSGGVYTALGDKADKTAAVSGVTYDTTSAPVLKQTVNGSTTTIETPDTTPTENSKHLLTSGGAFAAMSGLLDFDDIYGLGVRLPDTGIDANNYTTPGVYRMQTATGAGLSTNLPFTTSAFRLIVEYINNNNRIRQTFIPLADGAYFCIRNYTSSGWQPWYKFEGVQV